MDPEYELHKIITASELDDMMLNPTTEVIDPVRLGEKFLTSYIDHKKDADMDDTLKNVSVAIAAAITA
jgi:hypothetical protein